MSTATTRRRIRPALALLATALLTVGVLAPAGPADAAGVTTHAWMADEAIDLLESDDLAALLRAHRDQVVAGAMFPDAGYIPGYTWGEEAHWQRFVDSYAVQIMVRDDCGDMTDAAGPCAPMIAHLMGVQAHGIGDEVWDWLFEPYSPDLGEYYMHDDFGPFNSDGGQELTMDIVAVSRYGRGRPTVPPIPSLDDLVAAFEASGHGGTTAADFAIHIYGEVVWDAMNTWKDAHAGPLQEAMPWMSDNLVTAPGGVDFGAAAIAAAWESQWARLLGDPIPTEVSVTYPADGQRGIPASGWVRSYQPGSNPGRGGARTRIAASLTYALPYVGAPGGAPVSNQLPTGAMTLTERDTGTVLPNLSGFPRAVPYGADSGERMIGIQPGVDLQPCTWYRVDTTSALLDADARPVTSTSWEFRTGLDAQGTLCPDDPTDQEGLHGSVLGADGEPIQGVIVGAYQDSDGFWPSGIAFTDEDGSYSFEDLPDGSYRLIFSPPAGSGLALQWSGGSAGRSTAEQIQHDGATSVSVAHLARFTAVTGRVINASGEGVDGATVRVFSRNLYWLPLFQDQTDLEGGFAFEKLHPAEYWVSITLPDGSARRWIGGTTSARPAQPSFTVEPEEQLDLGNVVVTP